MAGFKGNVAYWRQKELDKLQAMNPEANAARMMNSYYRLCGLCDRNLEDDNNERRQNTAWHKANEEKEERWWKRLDAEFNKTFGLRLVYTTWFPRIGYKDEHGGFREAIHPHFYN